MSQLNLLFRRTFFQLMRTLKPVFHKGSQAWVFRDADVRDILTRDKDFTLRQVNAEMIERRIGTFLLSLDDGPQYQHEVGVMRSIIRREDPERIQSFTRTTATRLCQELSQRSTFDVVSEYTRIVPLRLLGDYFGIPGPEDALMLRWNRSLFWDIFLNLKGETGPVEAAEQSASAFNPYLQGLIASAHEEEQKGQPMDDTLLARLIQLQGEGKSSLDDEGIRRNLAGALLGTLEPISKACVNILNQFFHRSEILERAYEAAMQDDVETIGKLAFEAFRFHPNLPVILRYAEKDQLLKSGARIQAGSIVYAFIASAMFDPKKFPQPGVFREDRPREDYLFFGHGLHTCLGTYINYIVIPEMLMALLKHEALRPAQGKPGRIAYEGSFPDRWIWTSGKEKP